MPITVPESFFASSAATINAIELMKRRITKNLIFDWMSYRLTKLEDSIAIYWKETPLLSLSHWSSNTLLMTSLLSKHTVQEKRYCKGWWNIDVFGEESNSTAHQRHLSWLFGFSWHLFFIQQQKTSFLEGFHLSIIKNIRILCWSVEFILIADRDIRITFVRERIHSIRFVRRSRTDPFKLIERFSIQHWNSQMSRVIVKNLPKKVLHRLFSGIVHCSASFFVSGQRRTSS